MGVLSNRNVAWRQYLALVAALAAALVTFLATGRTIRPREEEPRVRLVDADTSARISAVQVGQARAASLWLDGRGFECLIPALYGAVESARFSDTLLARQPLAQRTPAVFADGPVGALWARLAQSFDAHALEPQIAVETGEPAIVTISRTAKFSQPDSVLAA